MRRRSIAVVFLAGLVACGPVGSTADVSGSPTATGSPNPTASAEPEVTPTTEASPFGIAVFPEPDDCTHPEGGYRVAYPADWYSNAAVPAPVDAAGQPIGEGIPACEYFAPTEFSLQYGTELPTDVAIFIRLFDLAVGADWDYGPYEGHRIISDSETTVDGQPARVQEIEVTSQDLIPFAPGDRYTQYVVEMSANRYLVAQTYSQQDYEANRLVLDQMMETLRFISS